MGPREPDTLTAETQFHQDVARHRWADDGGAIPEVEEDVTKTPLHFDPWVLVGLAAVVGFAFGWLTRRRYILRPEISHKAHTDFYLLFESTYDQ
ncbi:hypothetical protein [Fimbriiglobus ruber]|uniref:hypothetical protein n=1 Tax=Fimbriiglobus ruber TaxID=1908690 RepID=UPI00117B38FC|nr:hypothetical protein [Fimbriiglobus ruber]